MSRRTDFNTEKDIFLIRMIFIEIYIPLVVSFISSWIIGYEEYYGNMNILLNLKTNRTYVYLSKFIFTVLILNFIIFLENFVFIIDLNILKKEFSITFIICSIVLLSLSIIPVIVIHIFLSFVFGSGISILIGFIGMLLSILTNNGLAENIWYMIPWVIPVRMYIYLYLLMFNKGIIIKQSNIYLFLVFSWKGLLVNFLVLLVFTLAGIKWFNSFEGQKTFN